ncbi:MAG: TetR/AcrR family transcriptional regulator [Candidatus Omnitrophica bacterium]|nr:TetR/AcrR family transcriptional regulator [Candidatus Omnitrophota bacterium]
MVRILKNYEDRKNELLATAQRLFYHHGYDQTSVNNIIEAVGVSKGTFYYYFKSKEDLLDCIIDTMSRNILREMGSVINEAGLDALTKFRKVIDVTRRWRIANKELFMTVTKVMYRDENVFLRHKMDMRDLQLITPELSKIIKQGVHEGVFHISNPDDAAELIMRLSNEIKEVISKLAIAIRQHPENAALVERKLETFGVALERILGAPKHSLGIPDKELLNCFLKEDETL